MSRRFRGDALKGGACILEDGRRCDLRHLWYVMDGREFYHWTEEWSRGDRYTVVVYTKTGPALPLPPGRKAYTIIAPSGPGHLTLGCTWDRDFAHLFCEHIESS